MGNHGINHTSNASGAQVEHSQPNSLAAPSQMDSIARPSLVGANSGKVADIRMPTMDSIAIHLQNNPSSSMVVGTFHSTGTSAVMDQERAKMEKIWRQEIGGHHQETPSQSPMAFNIDQSNPPSPRLADRLSNSPSPPSDHTLNTRISYQSTPGTPEAEVNELSPVAETHQSTTV